jgi:hypothetical protein
MSEIPKLPNDGWHSYVYSHSGWLECAGCGAELLSSLALGKQLVDGELVAAEFTIRAVRLLKDLGWRCEADELWCQDCAALEFRGNFPAPDSK